ncbi:MAG: molybdenum cofactor guanylyltransferase [Bacteroidota bacterium]|nr:molybdenum cofactor guanylyltransferase [Bacteroidota bacterium]
MYNDITAIILSGGKSSRMGQNKSLMKIGKITIIELMHEKLRPMFKEIILITNDIDDYAFLKVPKYTDIYPGRGPLSGIHSALKNTTTFRNFIISCDIPLMKREMIEYLVNYTTSYPVTIAKADGFIQQLCGVYTKECLPVAENILKESIEEESRTSDQKKIGCRVLELINKIGAEVIDAQALPFYEKDMYFNMNKKDEFEFVKQKLIS